MSSSVDASAGIGVDFGTSNSLAAVRCGATRLVPLEADGPVMPTATYLDRDFHTLTGQAAIDRYIQDNTGRTVELVPEVIGEASLLVGESGARSRAAPETASQKVYGPALDDPGLPGRLFRGLKRLLGDPHTPRLMVFDQPYRLVALITPVLLRMRREIEAELERAGLERSLPPLCVGHPVHFEGRDPHRDRLALTRLEEACGYAGLAAGVALRFCPEPVAATLSWLHTAGAGGRGTALTVDFGGGTLDLALVRFDGRAMEILATAGEAVGGDHIDQRLFRELLFPLLGKGETWRRQGEERVIETRFPFERYEEALLNWTVGYTLNQNRFRGPVMECMRRPGAAGEKFRRLFDLITRNQGYQVFHAIRDAKARLSEHEAVTLDVPELDVRVALTRERFETLVADVLERLDAAVARVLAAADVPAKDVDLVLRTGGSSLVPAVRRVLERRFPRRVVEHDPFTSVAEGLAIAAAEGLRFDP